MALQFGIIKLKGRIDDLSFYQSTHGWIARRKGGPDANRIKNHPNFERTREHLSEFAKAGKAAKLIRQAFRSQFDAIADHKMTGRLVKMFLSAIRADKVNGRGNRNVMDGAPELLTNFQFNAQTNLRHSFPEEFKTSTNRTSGNMSISIPSFNPAMLKSPKGATHFRLTSAAAEIDFEKERVISHSSESPATKLRCKSTPEIKLTSVLKGTSKPLFISLGIQFFQMVNEELFPLNNTGHNAVAIVHVIGKVLTPSELNEGKQIAVSPENLSDKPSKVNVGLKDIQPHYFKKCHISKRLLDDLHTRIHFTEHRLSCQRSNQDLLFIGSIMKGQLLVRGISHSNETQGNRHDIRRTPRPPCPP